MIQDEFNNISVNNDKEFSKIEYGKVQKTEYSENGDMSLHGDNHKVNLNETTKQINAVTESGTATVVSSGATASSIAATTTSVVVVASTVAIGAISVVTGISVALHDYQYKFNSLFISSNQISYELEVDDLKASREEKEFGFDGHHQYEEDVSQESTLNLRVYNNNYDRTDEIYLWGPNYGTFSGLTLGETYTIVLSESRYGGEVLYQESFTTTKNAKFFDFYLEEGADLRSGLLYANLDFIDELDAFNDLTLTLGYENEEFMTFPVEKEVGRQQIVSPTGDFFLEEGFKYQYVFSYVKDDEKVVFKEGEISFYDTSEGFSEFYDFIFDGTANFMEEWFTVRLDYVDDFDLFSDFMLYFYYDEEDEYGFEVPLEKTNEEQRIYTDSLDISLSGEYFYQLKFMNDGELVELEKKPIRFTDISGAVVEFYEFIFDETANFDTREITLQLDFQDDLDYLYGFEFTVEDLETSETKTVYLEHTTEPQTFAFDEYSEMTADGPIYKIDLKEHEISYSFKYWNLDEEIYVVENKTCQLTNSLKSVFNGVDTTYDFIEEATGSYMLPIRFLFDDAAHEFEYFGVEVTKSGTRVAYLSVEGETVTDNWLYGVWYPDDGTTTVDDVIDTTEEVRLKVTTMFTESPEHPYAEEVTLYDEPATFTKNLSQENVLGVYAVSDVITAGSYEVGFQPVYTGEASRIECQIIFECKSKSTYTCNYNLPNKGSYSYVLLTECEEGINEEVFMSDFEDEVKITLRYCTISYVTGSGDSTGLEEVRSDYTTKVLYENYRFSISV